jgi:uncharacterized alkaline shock family protein YloU
VSGVYDLGGGASQVVGALRERIPGTGTNLSPGVSVAVAECGVSLAGIAAGLHRNVIATIKRMTGLEVTEVNVTVHDVHLPGGDGDDDTE